MILRVLIFIALSFSLSACLPAIFTVATTTGIVASKDQPMSETLNDARISASIKADLVKNNFRDLGAKIKVEVSQGRVLLTGNIQKESDALKAIEIAWNQKSVKEVINELKVNKNSNNFDLAQYTKDSMITTQIKAKNLVSKDIKFANYTILTIDNIVYLFGVARSEEELEKLASIASKIKGVEKVVCYAKIMNNFNTNNDNSEES
ncbi:BON domain-containing protein [Rickettsia conorii subsp. heilongjiangensis]|uniref:BON domain-containing protein n=1 Tax=Rickettsia conorii subsp. heilongjiangensis TaxID=226665 RepID=A0AAD1LSK0_RICCR|nr:BON domain-containing protein [Rickettsia conorii]AEK74583.1 lipoprotein [Rickettsia conorii subsp. heilongjiangensis 054]BBM91349.1 BON domain-containing protein [Rickettsia conorii subsp. heilongjiangensis]BBM92558.1 BON domain-containing protein [Rickettsia conorii subsp. heilongjiangensis]BBM93767.1 BON domain-containing protein [Rickettsia conorii subsp. heilongjiangensis]BBM94976.1 BON domain-containing protein [Rickettsia conorii subsp. heilongjiangensis]